MVTWEDCFKALLEREPKLLEKLCAYVASGGSELDYCEREGVLFGDLMLWVWNDIERRKAFESAHDMREKWIKEAVLREMRTLALSDIRACFDGSGGLLPMSQWPPAAAKAIQSIEVDEDGKMKLKLWDKGKQLEALAKKMGFFTEKHVHEFGGKLEDLIIQSYQHGADKSSDSGKKD